MISRNVLPPVPPYIQPISTVPVYFDHGLELSTPVYSLGDLARGQRLQGPALVIDVNSTVLLPRACTLSLSAAGDLDIEVGVFVSL